MRGGGITICADLLTWNADHSASLRGCVLAVSMRLLIESGCIRVLTGLPKSHIRRLSSVQIPNVVFPRNRPLYVSVIEQGYTVALMSTDNEYAKLLVVPPKARSQTRAPARKGT